MTTSTPQKEMTNLLAKRRRDYERSLSPEAKAELKQNRIWDKQRRENEKKERARIKPHKANVKRELAILSYMKKHDVLYHHHSRSDSMMKEIVKALDNMKQVDRDYIVILDKKYPNPLEYHPYVWNYLGEGKNYLPKCQLGCLWTGPFNTIYDVPLDGSYRFEIYDSGRRGLGSINGITASKIQEVVNVPKVAPGNMIPITVF